MIFIKSLLTIILLAFLPVFSYAQINPLFIELSKAKADSLREVLKQNPNDTVTMMTARDLAYYYLDVNSDSALYYVSLDLPLVQKLKFNLWVADAFDLKTIILSNHANYTDALTAITEASKIASDEQSEKNIYQISRFTNDQNPRSARLSMLAAIRLDLAGLYFRTENLEKAATLDLGDIETASSIHNYTVLSLIYYNLGGIYLKKKMLDSAVSFLEKALNYTNQSGYNKYKGGLLGQLGDIYLKKQNIVLAKSYFFAGLQSDIEQHNLAETGMSQVRLAGLYKTTGQYDSALYHARLGYNCMKSSVHVASLIPDYTVFADIYEAQNRLDSALYYSKLAYAINDSLNGSSKIKQFQNMGFDEQLRLQELERKTIETKNSTRTYALIAGLAVFSVFAIVLYRNNRQKQKANVVLQDQKEKVERTLRELSSTQAQLIQSEKMASLGELTAGIAHEIQNPLNFVNNFSEISNELIDEMNAEIEKGDMNEAKNIAKNIRQNLEKINHHGKRADAIVKGMLQHSRSSNGQKEPTDINALVDEYLRLAYHGLRAKDKSFNATLKTNYDETIGNINIISHDIGRVILNLITNAFYAVTEKKESTVESYEPIVAISTKKIDNKVEIRVTDNGNGIPSKVFDKIFQPFFTTKPTGRGTGLGLSLSYDIVKAHGGELRAETKEGEYAKFIIYLPYSS